MKNFLTVCVCAIALVFLVNTGFQSTNGNDKPAINFYGTVKVRGQNDRAENMLIGGYEGIKFYLEPENTESDPKAAYAELRLDDIQSISSRTKKTGPGDNIKKFKGIEYVQINIQFKNSGIQQKKPYLVELSRKLSYDIPSPDPSIEPLKQDVRFDALEEMIIEGHRQRPRDDKKQNNRIQKSAAQEAICTQAKKNIKQLEKESKGVFDDFVSNIKEAVYYLCG